MLRRTFLYSAARASALAPFAIRRASGARRRTNILFVVADDLGLQVGCYGERRIRTPNMDRLASEGVRFKTAYVTQSSCSPSRSSILTGMFPHSTGQYGLEGAGFRVHSHLLRGAIPTVLKQAGYRTGVVGKVHVEPESEFVFDFDRRQDYEKTREIRHAAALAREFLRSTGDAPFFLYMNFADPHAFRDKDDPNKWYFPPQVDGFPEKPLQPGPETVWDFQGIDTPYERQRVANYLNAVQRFDTGLGMVLQELKEAGKAADTLVIVIGDNGPPFQRGKTTCYEAGLRTPFLVKWPGVTRAMTSEALVSTVDIAPTFFDAAGVRSPVATHGSSLRGVLTGDLRGWREYLAGEFHFHGAKSFFPRRAIRDQRYKLIHNLLAGRAKAPAGIDADQALRAALEPRYEGTLVRAAFERYANPPEFELYDLQTDPVEFVNLAGKPGVRDVEERLRSALMNWRKQTDDPFLQSEFTERMLREGGILLQSPPLGSSPPSRN